MYLQYNIYNIAFTLAFLKATRASEREVQMENRTGPGPRGTRHQGARI